MKVQNVAVISPLPKVVWGDWLLLHTSSQSDLNKPHTFDCLLFILRKCVKWWKNPPLLFVRQNPLCACDHALWNKWLSKTRGYFIHPRHAASFMTAEWSAVIITSQLLCKEDKWGMSLYVRGWQMVIYNECDKSVALLRSSASQINPERVESDTVWSGRWGTFITVISGCSHLLKCD